MDDLDHSVEIAEQDWENFYEDSEECSIQQAGLAGLDDSGFSDTDDEKNSTQETALPSQVESNKPINECCAAPHPTHEADGSLSNKADTDTSAEQTVQINLTTTSVCFTSDSNVSENVIGFNDQQQNSSETELHSSHEDTIGQAVWESSSSSSHIQDTEISSSEENMISKMMERSDNPKKEKERWFVTVNDSPVRMRVNRGISGQKKEKKKKSSRTSVKQTMETMEKQCSLVNFEEEKERKNKFKQMFSDYVNLNACSNNINEEVTSNSSNIKEDVLKINEKCCIPKIICTLESFTAKDKNPVDLFSCESEGTAGVLPKILENNSFASPKEPSLFNFTDTQQLLTNEQHIPSQPKMTIPEFNILSNVNDEPLEDSLMKGFSTLKSYSTASIENLSQNLPTQSQTDDKIFFLEETSSQKLPSEDLESAVGPVCPIYALSSFWAEMEKLTINDILHIRSAHNESPLEESVTAENAHIEDKNLLSIQDGSLIDDGADSGYFTNVEDSKPDRLSWEVSTISDLDWELLQIPNPSATPSPEPQNFKGHREMFKSTYKPYQELDVTTIKIESDLERLKFEDEIPLYLYPDIEPQSLPLTLNMDSSLYDLDSNRTPSVLADGNTLNYQSFLTFSDELRTRPAQRSVLSLHHSRNLSVVETYDDFFSDFEVGNLFFPPVPEKTVPIFSTSHSVVNNYYEKDIGDNTHNPVKHLFSSQLEIDTGVSGTPNLCLFTSQRKNWRSLLSFRRIGFTGKGSTWYQRVSSWIFPKEATKSITYVMESQQVIPLLPEEWPQHSVLIPKNDEVLFTIKQADMCLVCIAFASWVLKSSNPQSTDTWKTALLANVSAISAIQYLRKYVKKEI